jgi:plasmid stabilization system protein ParE
VDRCVGALSPAVLAGLGVELPLIVELVYEDFAGAVPAWRVERAVREQIDRLAGARATAYLPSQIRRDARRRLSAQGVRIVELRLVIERVPAR